MSNTPAVARALLDTDIFSEFLRGRNTVVAAHAKLYRNTHSQFTISAITMMELCSGWQRRGLQAQIDTVLQLIRNWEVLAIDGDIAALAGRIDGDLIRTGQPIGLADPLIAATALHHRLMLVTGNMAHYQRLHALGYPVLLTDWRQ